MDSFIPERESTGTYWVGAGEVEKGEPEDSWKRKHQVIVTGGTVRRI